MKNVTHTLMLILVISIFASCNKTELDNLTPTNKNGEHRLATAGDLPNSNFQPVSSLGSTKLYYQHQQYTVMLKNVTDVDAVNPAPTGLDQLFVYDASTAARALKPIARQMAPAGSSVLQSVIIHFNAGIAPQQFYSSSEVFAAARGIRPSITLEPTTNYVQLKAFNSPQQTTGGGIDE
ncbi:MAG TPA: hypothetical protein VK174_18775 [Chitinophagales bacterium]|nr:hypothetical protein [Chitinophagales bacterium]